MEKLPLEILQNTFTLLSLNDRTVCLRVCRHWWSVLDKYCLFYNVVINKSNKFTQFMDLMERSPRHAAQVEMLNISWHPPTSFNKRVICTMFPNARILDLGWCEYTYFEEPLVVSNSNSKIQSISDNGHCELLSQILFSNLGACLKSICLYFNDDTSNSRAIVSQLKNLPVLKSLKMQRLAMEIKDLEELHNNLPTVQEFVVEYLHVLASAIPENIVPLAQIQSFQMHVKNVDNVETHIALYKYIAKKYIHAAKSSVFNSILSRLPFNDQKNVYENGVVDYWKCIGQKKTELNIFEVPDGINIFKAFDNIDSPFEEFNIFSCGNDLFFDHLAQSNQAKYLKRLHLESTVIKSPDILKNMSALTTLMLFTSFVYHSEPINFTNYLNACPPTVMEFIVVWPSLIITPFRTRMSTIQKLDITCENLTKPLAETITSCFPSLVELTLDGEVPESINITLHQSSLQKVTIGKGDGCHGLTFKSTSQTEPQHYICKDKHVVHTTSGDIILLPNLTITSFTDKKFDIQLDCNVGYLGYGTKNARFPIFKIQ
jgi:hypothetical protein